MVLFISPLGPCTAALRASSEYRHSRRLRIWSDSQSCTSQLPNRPLERPGVCKQCAVEKEKCHSHSRLGYQITVCCTVLIRLLDSTWSRVNLYNIICAKEVWRNTAHFQHNYLVECSKVNIFYSQMHCVD